MKTNKLKSVRMKNYYTAISLIICSQSLISLSKLNAQINYGTGAEGRYVAPAGQSTLSGVHNFTTCVIPAGATVSSTGGVPLVILCTDSLIVKGTISAAGGNGSVRNGTAGGAGGSGGSGGWGGAGGAGGSTANQLGKNGVSFATFNGNGYGGSGYGGAKTLSGGTGGSYGMQGQPATDCGSGCGTENYNLGSVYGDALLSTKVSWNSVVQTRLLGGSGGGGGGGRLAGFNEGGGGGGGGAGALQLSAAVIVLNTGSQVSVRGGDAPDDLGSRAGVGGGGSGGTLLIQYRTSSTVPPVANTDPGIANALADIAGGWGGNHGQSTYTIGGDGGQGRYFVEQDNSCNYVVFTTQPSSPSAMCSPASASFTVVATGDSPSYQWQVFSTGTWNNLNDGGSNPQYSGTQTVSLNVLNAATNQQYRCVGINCSGHNTLSNPATLTVIVPANFISISQNKIKCKGDTATLKVVATGDAMSYQWTKNGTSIAGASGSQYSVLSCQLSDSGTYVCNFGNLCKSFSPSVHLTVNQKAVFTDTISDQVRCQGDSLRLSFAVVGANLSYQWTKGGNNISGATNSVYKTGYLKAADYDIYSCKVTNMCGTTALPNFIIKVNTPPSSSTVYVTQMKNIGDSISYALSPSGTGPFTYQWYKSDVRISGATGSTFKVNPITCADSGIYTCRIKNDCDSILSKVARVFVINCSRFKFAISGFVKYDNADSTVMSSKTAGTTTTVYLKNSANELIDSVNTDDAGNYAFINIINDTYNLYCKTLKPWGGGNPVDALMVNRNYIGLYSITDPLKKLAADVNADTKINPTDALMINRRYIGILKKYNAGDWIFETPTVVINGANAAKNIRAICRGDVNTSDIPPLKIMEY